MTDCQLETSSSNENGGLEKDLAVAEDSSLIIDSSIVYGGEILDHEDISYCVKVASVETTCSTSDGQQCEPDVILSDQVLFCEDPEQVDLIEAKPTDEEADDDVIMQHMDIQEPLTTLRKLLEIQMRCSLEEYEFWLQDTIKLDPSQNLVSQCVQGSGTVQINLEVKSYPNMAPRFNIVDVLKPADEDDESLDLQVPAVPRSLNVKFACQSIEPKETVSRWIIDHAFRREQEKLGIPLDPAMWNYEHVRHWIHWAVKKFSLRGVDVANFTLTGQELIALTHEQFVKYIPCDYNDVFWTHLELLRKCKFIAVQHAPSGTNKLYMRKVKATSVPSSATPINCKTAGTASSGSGQVQLWQFLLDLLTDASYRPVIQWIGDEGEFKLNDPELVAQLWGQRKGKPAMNYEKLSRALRYYYDGDMIAKVHGKRFVYKFVCDLRSLLGYSAAELNQLTLEALGQLQRTDHVINGGVLLQSNELYSI